MKLMEADRHGNVTQEGSTHIIAQASFRCAWVIQSRLRRAVPSDCLRALLGLWSESVQDHLVFSFGLWLWRTAGGSPALARCWKSSFHRALAAECKCYQS